MREKGTVGKGDDIYNYVYIYIYIYIYQMDIEKDMEIGIGLWMQRRQSVRFEDWLELERFDIFNLCPSCIDSQFTILAYCSSLLPSNTMTEITGG